MFNPVEIACNACKTKFLPKSERNIYCTRKCFKKYFYHKKKAEELANIKFPFFLCPSCKRKIELDFDPVKSASKWEHFACPHCNVLMINVSENIVAQDITL